MSYVFVVDADRRPQEPLHPGRARHLLTTGHAAVLRRYPFTLILKEHRPEARSQPLRVKIDPGSWTTGLAVVNDATGQVVWAGEVKHRGQQVKERLDQRRACRRSRRQRHTRYRRCRSLNRRRHTGWLAPSLESRTANVTTWVARLRCSCSVGAISQELVKFDTHLLQNPEISGVLYQQGTLAGYEVREYLLQKWDRACAYCGATGVPLEVDHIIPRGRPGGSDRVSNLTLACRKCNQEKGNRTPTEWWPDDSRCQRVAAQAKRPLADAAAANITRWALYHRLEAMGLPVETGTGGRTKWNRIQRGLDKTHWLDAACVGASTPERLQVRGVVPLQITAMGRHSRQMCRTNRYGFPDKASKATSVVGSFRTGDLVRAVVPAPSAKSGRYLGRLAVRATGSCNIKTHAGTVQGIHVRYCRPLQRGDGYWYTKGGAAFPPQA